MWLVFRKDLIYFGLYIDWGLRHRLPSLPNRARILQLNHPTAMLHELLEKLGIKDFGNLKEAERKVYLNWAEILSSKKDITIEDLKRILPAELERANKELADFDGSAKKLNYYQAYANLCRFLITTITGPAEQRKQLEQQLKQKFKL